MIRIALYTDDERIPAVSPIDAKISPTSPRGTIPTPTSSFDVSDRVTPKPDTSLPMIATTVRIRPTKSTPRSKSALPGMNRRTFTGAPTATKKIGVKMSATGSIRSTTASNWLVEESTRPAAKAPMIIADPARSASAAIASAKQNAATSSTPRVRIRSTKSKIVGAKRVPRTTASTRKPTANRKILPTERTPSAAPPTIPDTTARITIPSTSSITAAPMMILASGVCIRFKSDSTRAVMPTEVAVRVAPTKMATTANVMPSGWTPIEGLA